MAAVRRAIDSGRPPHALLLVGPRGSGKTTLAEDLAAGLLCTAADPADRPCRACPACRKVDHGNHPDLHRIVPEGAGDQIRLAQVQGLVSELALLPMEGRRRVAIIGSAHRMNPDAQNALLKTLEEPVGEATIVLCADEQAPILPTVVSRSHRLRFGPVSIPEVEALIVERGVADAPRARAAAIAAGGLPGIALVIAANPDTTLVADRLARTLVDLLGADRRTRLGAVASLVADGAALDAALRGAADASADPDGTPAATAAVAPTTAASKTTKRARAATVAPTDDSAEPPAPASGAASRRPQPAERRRAAVRVIEAWRGVGRDLAVAGRGGRAQLRRLDLLEELEAAAPRLDPAELAAFLDRLDAMGAAIEAYANPELVLDHLVLAWPRLRGRAAA
ncbi:MAG: DNA polymerase III subunit [Chloroflexota bacterium]